MEHRHGSRRDVRKDNGQDMQVSANNPHNIYRVAQNSSVARRRGEGDQTNLEKKNSEPVNLTMRV